jgi:hypothetical protein
VQQAKQQQGVEGLKAASKGLSKQQQNGTTAAKGMAVTKGGTAASKGSKL